MSRSEAHDALTAAAEVWLSNMVTARGLCWATEVPMPGTRYIADGAALARLQFRFHDRYIGREHTRTWLPSVSTDLIFVFDAKVSKADYRNSKPQLGAGGGNLHWIVAPRNLLDPNEVTGLWGLLIPYGAGLREIKRPRFLPSGVTHIHAVGYNILWAINHESRRKQDKDFRAYSKELHAWIRTGTE